MPTKKTTKKTPAKKVAVKKPVVKTAPVMEHKCECGENCKCHCHGGAHFVKHIIVWAIIFAIGMVCGKMLPCGPHHKPMPKMHPVFVNGCLDMASIKCPMMQEKLATADADNNECISLEEYKAIKKEMQPLHKGKKTFNGMRGPKGPKGPKMPKADK